MNGIAKTAFAILASSSLTLGLPLAGEEPARANSDEGYFLDWSQKGQLIWKGSMTDGEGNVYNVKIVPGYAPMWDMAAKHYGEAGKSFAEYGEGKTYSRIYNTSKDILRGSNKDIIWKWGIKGSYLCWGEHFSSAAQSVSRRSFGWFMAYPAAFGLSTAESVGRLASGIPLGACGNALGISAVPVAMAAWPSIKGSSEALVPGTLVPIMGAAWNTVDAPFLSVTGQRPAPSRVDGFFVTMKPKPMPKEKSQELVKSIQLLKPIVEEAQHKRHETAAKAKADFQQAYSGLEKQIDAEDAEKEAKIKAALDANPELKKAILKLYDDKRLKADVFDEEELKKAGLTRKDIENVIAVLVGRNAAPNPWEISRECKPREFKNKEPLIKSLGK